MAKGKVSVVIRTRNYEQNLPKLLEILTHQTLRPSELIIVNNYSTEDQSEKFQMELRKILSTQNKILVKLVTISDKDFSHQYSTNIGLAATNHEFVCITNAHSLPLSQSWLEDGTQWFGTKNIAGVSGFFFPKEDQKIKSNFSNTIYYLIEKYALKLRWCSTMNCVIRKSLWKEYPFDENLPLIIPETRNYGLEDFDWSLEMIHRGFQIIIDPRFSIYHSHDEGVRETKRNVKNYFVYRKLQKKIEHLKRPRQSISKVEKPVHFVEF